MKFKRIALLLLAVAIIGSGSVFADTIYKNYLAKKITVKVNNNKLEITGLAVDMDKENKDTWDIPMVTVDSILSTVGGISTYNSKENTINIYKPNVQLSVYEKENKSPFGRVTKGDKIGFNVFAQVDSLAVDISSIIYVVKDPFGTDISSDEIIVKKSQENFYSVADMKVVHFKYTGKYTVNMYMKAVGSEDYSLVSQLGIYSESQ